jgi:hypothetical protein
MDAIFFFALGIVAVVVGVLYRLGHFRTATRRTYFNPDNPILARHSMLGAPVSGLWFIVIGLASLADKRSQGQHYPALLVALLVLFSIGLMGFYFYVIWRPPDWLKPRWLREEEGQKIDSEIPISRHDKIYVAAMAALVVLALVSTIAILIGVK